MEYTIYKIRIDDKPHPDDVFKVELPDESSILGITQEDQGGLWYNTRTYLWYVLTGDE